MYTYQLFAIASLYIWKLEYLTGEISSLVIYATHMGDTTVM